MKTVHVHVHGALPGFKTQDDWAKWNEEHKDRAARHGAMKHVGLKSKAQLALHEKAAEAHKKAHEAITAGKHEEAANHAAFARHHEEELRKHHGYLPKPIKYTKDAATKPCACGGKH